jgi:xanthine dehydrogenase YagT iron-sulfur-binding subunit
MKGPRVLAFIHDWSGDDDPIEPVTFTRREFTLGSLYAGAAVALFGCHGKEPPPKHEPPPPKTPPPQEYDVTLNVNGSDRHLRLEARVSLLDALRERLGLTGTKKGCDHGQCGACTVHVDGRRIKSCMQLAIMSQGQKITTIEGLAHGDALHPMQAAFVEHDGFQCGYCTPGQIMSAVGLLAEGRAKTDAGVREHMSGNICRCGAYPNIIAAIQTARKAGA